MIKLYASNSKATCRPTMHTLYFVKLLVQLKFSLTEIGICWPFGDTKTAPTPFLMELAAPLK